MPINPKKTLGEDHINTANTLGNAASLYLDMGLLK